jgi:hypothetical protein
MWVLALSLPVLLVAQGPGQRRPAPPLRFEVGLGRAYSAASLSGRLFVVVRPANQPATGRGAPPGSDSSRFEPRMNIGSTGRPGAEPNPVFAHDVRGLAAGRPGVVDVGAPSFPVTGLWQLPAGDYLVQAVLDTNQDSRGVNAPGNLYSDVRRVRLDPWVADVIHLDLTRQVPAEAQPVEGVWVKYVRLKSQRLTEFYGRPMFLRAGVILPRDYGFDPAKRYPLRVRIGGYGARYTNVARMMDSTNEFRRAWAAPDAPSFIVLYLDGDGPLGDPLQVNSANHGPYATAIMQELIPRVEQLYNGIGTPQARVLDGTGAGGWAALALQLFYPDFFNGAWSVCPEGVDLHALKLLNIYEDTNAFVNRYGFERPSVRDRNGDVRLTMKHEVQLENVLGEGDSWTMSAAQWGALNAVFSPRGADGHPVPLWDARTGRIDGAVVPSWQKYDLRHFVDSNWKSVGRKLQGKIHISVGDADDLFITGGIRSLESSLTKAQPAYGGSITYGQGRGSCWVAWTPRQMMDEMAKAVGVRR